MDLITRGVAAAIRELRHEVRIQRTHNVAIRRARRFESRPNLKLHLGSGSKYKPGWINIDFGNEADLRLDIREDPPFVDRSVLLIYSEHVFEHLEYPSDAVHLLRESLRVLQPGGTFRIGVPDGEEALLQYAHGTLPSLFPQWSQDYTLRYFPPWVWTTPMHYINFFFRQGGEHKYAYDFETLALVLSEAGFCNIRRRDFQPDMDCEDRRDGTLYVEASKPDRGPVTPARIKDL